MDSFTCLCLENQFLNRENLYFNIFQLSKTLECGEVSMQEVKIPMTYNHKGKMPFGALIEKI